MHVSVQAQIGSEEGVSLVKWDLGFAIPKGGLHRINITPKPQLSKSTLVLATSSMRGYLSRSII